MVFERYNAWRLHPDLKFNFRKITEYRHAWPGFGTGLALFAAYVALEKIGLIGGGDHGHGHGSHGSHGNKHHCLYCSLLHFFLKMTIFSEFFL